MLHYLFWPNPPAPFYSSPKVIVILLICAALIVSSMIIKRWRIRHHNAVTRKLSRTWQSALFWFGIIGLFMVVCRVEGISYLSMRFWWIIWGVSALLYTGFQIKMFRSRHYEVLPTQSKEEDPLEKYLPKKKR